jgi:peptidoglycan/xylan/chitin deacetylase (PgdA/CDA1 family)
MKRIYGSVGLVCAVFTTIFAQTASITTWKNDAKAAYSIIHDDYGDPGVDGIWQHADTIASNRGVKFTIGAISSQCEYPRNINEFSNPYGYAKEVMMNQHGHEIMSHSHTHSCAVGNAGWSPCSMPTGQGWGESGNFADEIIGCTESIEDGTGHKPQFYIFPFDRFTNTANDKLKELGYIGSRTGWSSPAGESFYRNGYNANDLNTFYPDQDGFFRSAVQVFDDNDANSSNHGAILNAEVDRAISSNQWANRELHNVGNSGWGHVSIKGYRDHINYLQQKIANGDLWVGTISEILTYQMQKLKYQPIINQTATSTWQVGWDVINSQYDINPATYLAGLNYTSPITLRVDLEGKAGLWEITQNNSPVVYEIKDGVLFTNVYPHLGSIELDLI